MGLVIAYSILDALARESTSCTDGRRWVAMHESNSVGRVGKDMFRFVKDLKEWGIKPGWINGGRQVDLLSTPWAVGTLVVRVGMGLRILSTKNEEKVAERGRGCLKDV
jgi:hypothetical protein